MGQAVHCEVILSENVGDALQVVRFADLVARVPRADAGKFTRVAPDGRVPRHQEKVEEESPKEEALEVVIPPEEVSLRRQENVERETFRKVFSAAEKAGLEMGRQQMEQELSLVLPRLENLLRGLEVLPARLYAEAEQLIVETAILLVREILGYELHVDPEGLVRRIGKALQHLDGQKEMTLCVAPEDAIYLERVPSFKKLQIKADESISPGSFRLESSVGGVEHDLKLQLQEIETALRSHLRERLWERESAAGNGETLGLAVELGAEASSQVRAEVKAHTEEMAHGERIETAGTGMGGKEIPSAAAISLEEEGTGKE
ncbi:MAG: hypothetical protein HQL63_12325 [Magnetococcales bacterium]|nr:hypothetical protein [Magnetococcales bacterium]MBF0321983.1 hypothetical protein [Magnetococcales bacterium]